MAIGMAYLEVLLVRVVLSALFLAQVDQTFATARPKCGVPHWPATAATGLTCEVLLPREALNFSHRLNPGKIEGRLTKRALLTQTPNSGAAIDILNPRPLWRTVAA